MPTRTRDPENVIVQMQVRMPWWRRAQLEDIAADSGTSVAMVIQAALDKVYPPKRRAT